MVSIMSGAKNKLYMCFINCSDNNFTFVENMRNTTYKSDLVFNIFVGQVIALCLVSGGAFTQNISGNLGVQIPILQLTCMYLPLTLYLFIWAKHKFSDHLQSQAFIKKRWFFVCALVDIHATLLIVFAYNFTSITSVMLLEDFTIPSAFLLSVFFLKVKYSNTHKFALLLCIAGMTFSICNDVFVKDQTAEQEPVPNSSILGDVMALSGAFLYALSNILQEHFLKTTRDVHHYLGFLGLFGVVITLVEATIFDEFTQL